MKKTALVLLITILLPRPNSYCLPEKTEVGIYGPKAEPLEKLFSRMQVKSKVILYGEEISYKDFEIVAIAPAANRDNPALFVKTKDIFKGFVKDGGFLLILHPHRVHWDDGYLPYPIRLGAAGADTVQIREEGHPVFQGLREENLGHRYAKTGGVKAWCGITELDSHWKVIATAEPSIAVAEPTVTVLVEASYGKGHVLLSCFDPFFAAPDNIGPLQMNKLRLLANMLGYAFRVQGMNSGPTIVGIEEQIKKRKVELKGETFSNQELTNTRIGPAGGITDIHYKGEGLYLNSTAFMLHYNSNGEKKSAGISSSRDGSEVLRTRYSVDMEIPTSWIDRGTAFTSLLSQDSDLRMEITTAFAWKDRFIIREYRINNLGKSRLQNAKLITFASLTPGRSIQRADRNLKGYYHSESDIFYVKNDNVEGKRVCGISGKERSVEHDIDTASYWGSYVRKNVIAGKECNNKDKGQPGGCMAWSLGEIQAGKSKTCVEIIALGDSFADIKSEIAKARKWYEQNKSSLASKIDRNALIKKHTLIDWHQRTHLYVKEPVNRKDPDNDGWNNEIEQTRGSDPRKEDTDGDKLIDPIDPHPLIPEKPIVVTSEDVAKDRMIINEKREIIRSLRIQRNWRYAVMEQYGWNLGNTIAFFKYLGVNSLSLSLTAGGKQWYRVGWKSNRFSRFFTEKDYAKGDPLARFIAACHKHGIMVTEHPGGAGLEDFYSPEGGLHMIRNAWCSVDPLLQEVQVERHRELAHYPFDIFFIFGEEYGFTDGFRHNQGFPCYCRFCQNTYREDMGEEIPDLANKGVRLADLPGRTRLGFLRWRYKYFTRLFKDCCRAVKNVNPRLDTTFMGEQHLYNVSTTYGKANSWERLGHEALDYSGGHLYTPKEWRQQPGHNHLVFPVTMKQRIGASSKRWAWMEAGEGRPYYEPIQTYGPQISNIAHGGKATQYFDIRYLIQGSGNYVTGGEPVWAKKTTSTDLFYHLKTAFDTITAINDWVIDAQSPKAIALIYCRQGDEVYDFVPEMRNLSLGAPSIAQRLFATYLLRKAYPYDLYYMRYLKLAELRPYKVILLPAPFAMSQRDTEILERLARRGSNIVIMGDYGQVDADANLHRRGALLDLAGIKSIDPSQTQVGKLSFRRDSLVLSGQEIENTNFKVYADIAVRADTRALTKMNGKDAGIYLRRVGKGKVIFMAGDFAINSVYPPSWSKKPAKHFKITEAGAGLVSQILDHVLGEDKSIINYGPVDDANADLEVALLENNPRDKVLFVLNWEYEKPVTLNIGVNLPKGVYRVTERDLKEIKSFRLDGKDTSTNEELAKFQMKLRPQAVRILHITSR